MLCRRCERSESTNGAMPTRAPRLTQPLVPLGARARSERRGQSQCTACGAALEADVLTERVREKQSQLARFGLAERGVPLLRATDPKEE
jgi:hypothetical protein